MKNSKEPNRSVNWKFWAGLLISALFLFLAFKEVDVGRTWAVIRSADIFPLLLVGVIAVFQYVIRAWRWRILLEPIKETRFSNRFLSTLIGFAANCVLPARLGEFLRANYLGHTEDISRSSAFGSIVVERIFDGFTLLLVLMIGLVATTFPEQLRAMAGSLRTAGLLLLLVYILIIIFLVGFKHKAEPFLHLLERLLFFLPAHLLVKIIDIVRNFSLGLVLVNTASGWTRAVFYSLLLWFTSLYQIHLVVHSFGLELPFISTFLILAMASFGVMIPSAPGYIGTFHLAVQYGFLFYGIGKEEALSAAIMWHASFFFPTILFGFIAFLILQSYAGTPSEETCTLEEA
ncbi:MAG: flippase-like domain-containing protein [Deltaproteobacteria bacterium]|nr:flippase-like domain-containing protein [Deltaproteobacteria bacterium]